MTEASSTLWRRLRWIVARFDEQSCLTIAGSLTFTSLLALVPAMTVVYLGLAFLPAYAALATQAEDFIFENFIPSSSLLVQEKLAEFAGRAEGLTELGLLGLALTTLMLLLTIERHFNAIWQVEKPKWTLARVLLLALLLTIGPALVLTGISVSTYLLSLPLLATVDIIGIAPLALNHLPTLCLFAVFSCLFAFVPNAVVGAREALLGGGADDFGVQDGFCFVRLVFAVLCLQRHIWRCGSAAGIPALVIPGLGDRPFGSNFRLFNGWRCSAARQLSALSALSESRFNVHIELTKILEATSLRQAPSLKHTN